VRKAKLDLDTVQHIFVSRVTTHLENLEKSGNSRVVREKSGKMEKVSVTLKSASSCS